MSEQLEGRMRIDAGTIALWQGMDPTLRGAVLLMLAANAAAKRPSPSDFELADSANSDDIRAQLRRSRDMSNAFAAAATVLQSLAEGTML